MPHPNSCVAIRTMGIESIWCITIEKLAVLCCMWTVIVTMTMTITVTVTVTGTVTVTLIVLAKIGFFQNNPYLPKYTYSQIWPKFSHTIPKRTLDM